MAINKVQYGNTTLIDLTDTTAVASDVASGKYFYGRDGVRTEGTGTGGGQGGNVWQDQAGYVHLDDEAPSGQITVQSLSVTQNGTYTASTGYAYSPVTVNVSGGGGGASKKQINFIDYDGSIVDSYTKTEWQSVSALPSNPSHTGLTAQGWNWTKAQIDAQLTAMPDGDIWVGQMYITQSGDTEIDVSMPYGRLDPILTICVNGEITVDWGDNTTPDTVTGTSLTSRKAVSHTYAAEGDYTISIHAVSGYYTFYNSTAYLILRKDTAANSSRVYANCIQNVRLGSGITSIGQYAFYYCYSLASITIPDTVTSIGSSAFSSCYSLVSITIPDTVTSIGSSAFSSCYSLASITIPDTVTSIESSAFSSCSFLVSITIPNTVTSIGNNAFQYCYSLANIAIPDTVTSIESSAFSGCYSLANITIPDTVTSIKNNAFQNCYSLTDITISDILTSIGSAAFQYCYPLASVTIPDTVTSIGDTAFQYCYGMAEYHILPTTPPTLGTNVFGSIQSDCKIYVPSASLSNYQTATNWSTYASYMVGE